MSNIQAMRRTDKDKLGILNLINKNFLNREGLIVLQIGSFAGESAQLMLSTGKVEQIYCVDPWQNGYDSQDPASRNCSKFQQAFDARFNSDPRVHKIKGFSQDVIGTFQDNFFDLIYVDGNHQQQAVQRDLKLAIPKLKQDGVLAGHDYSAAPQRLVGVIKAVNRVLGRGPEHVFQDTSWSCAKAKIRKDKKGITIITPTCGRPQQLSLVIQCINNQTVKPDMWIIVDDGPQSLPEDFFKASKIPVEYVWHQKKYQKSTTQNSLLALQKVNTDMCIVIQDDDYYPPVYIQTVSKLLADHNDTFLGNLIWYIYRLSTGFYKVRNGVLMKPRCRVSFQWHSAAFIGAGIRAALINIFEAHIGQNYPTDILAQILVDTLKYNFLLPDLKTASCISLKDYGVGTPGWMAAHRKNDAMIADTQDFSIFKSWLGDDWTRYQKYLGRLR